MADSGLSVTVFKHFRISSVLRHIQAYLGVNGHIQGCFWHFYNLCNPGIFKTLVYLEPGRIQNSVKQLLWSVL